MRVYTLCPFFFTKHFGLTLLVVGIARPVAIGRLRLIYNKRRFYRHAGIPIVKATRKSYIPPEGLTRLSVVVLSGIIKSFLTMFQSQVTV